MSGTSGAADCAGTRCTGDDGQLLLGNGGDELDLATWWSDDAVVERGSRAGFDTGTLQSTYEADEAPVGGIDAFPPLETYGFWGVHGFAGVILLHGPFSSDAEGVSGEMGYALPYALGNAVGANPAGVGGATWSGVAEAVDTRTFERRQGTSTLTIADLSTPRVSVGIDVPGYTIGSPAWASMPLAGGHFSVGVAGADYLAGDFYGPAHSEVYGVFDTGDYAGVFGGKR